MTNFIKIILTAVFGAIIEALLKVFKKSPEQIARERIDEILNENIERNNSDDPGYRLPSGTSDQWGETITTQTRVEPGKTNGIKRPASSS
jgi:hypothetical protein